MVASVCSVQNIRYTWDIYYYEMTKLNDLEWEFSNLSPDWLAAVLQANQKPCSITLVVLLFFLIHAPGQYHDW